MPNSQSIIVYLLIYTTSYRAWFDSLLFLSPLVVVDASSPSSSTIKLNNIKSNLPNLIDDKIKVEEKVIKDENDKEKSSWFHSLLTRNNQKTQKVSSNNNDDDYLDDEQDKDTSFDFENKSIERGDDNDDESIIQDKEEKTTTLDDSNSNQKHEKEKSSWFQTRFSRKKKNKEEVDLEEEKHVEQNNDETIAQDSKLDTSNEDIDEIDSNNDNIGLEASSSSTILSDDDDQQQPDLDDLDSTSVINNNDKDGDDKGITLPSEVSSVEVDAQAQTQTTVVASDKVRIGWFGLRRPRKKQKKDGVEENIDSASVNSIDEIDDQGGKEIDPSKNLMSNDDEEIVDSTSSTSTTSGDEINQEIEEEDNEGEESRRVIDLGDAILEIDIIKTDDREKVKTPTKVQESSNSTKTSTDDGSKVQSITSLETTVSTSKNETNTEFNDDQIVENSQSNKTLSTEAEVEEEEKSTNNEQESEEDDDKKKQHSKQKKKKKKESRVEKSLQNAFPFWWNKSSTNEEKDQNEPTTNSSNTKPMQINQTQPPVAPEYPMQMNPASPLIFLPPPPLPSRSMNRPPPHAMPNSPVSPTEATLTSLITSLLPLVVRLILVSLLSSSSSLLGQGDHIYSPEPSQHYIFERLNDRYSKDNLAMKQALEHPPSSRSKYSWKLSLNKRRKDMKKQLLLAANDTKEVESNNLPAAPIYSRTVIVMDVDTMDTSMDTTVENLRDSISCILRQFHSNNRLDMGSQLEVVVCIESPGGVVQDFGLAADQLTRLKEAGEERGDLILTVCVDKIAASGGYMMACQASPGQLIAAPFAILGSIGVLRETINFHDVLEKYGKFCILCTL